jgi:hypothetical protein
MTNVSASHSTAAATQCGVPVSDTVRRNGSDAKRAMAARSSSIATAMLMGQR